MSQKRNKLSFKKEINVNLRFGEIDQQFISLSLDCQWPLGGRTQKSIYDYRTSCDNTSLA